MISNESPGVAKEVAIEATAAMIGAAIAGPPGALLGAVSKPVLSAIANREKRNAARLGMTIRELTGLSEQQLNDWTLDRESRIMVVTSAINAAQNTIVDQKIDALAKVVADCVSDPACIDTSGLIVAALRELEAPHIRVLAAICRGQLPPHETEKVAPEACTMSQLCRRFPNLASGMYPITATLTRIGILDNSSMWGISGDKVWRVTNFAYQCLEYLEIRTPVE